MSKFGTKSGRALAVAVSAVLAVTMAGCASNDSGGSSDASPGSTSGPLSLKVGQISNSIAYFPIFIAKSQGFFKQENLTVGDIPLLGTGAKLAAALQSGSIDVAGGNMTDPFNLYKVNKGARIISSLVNSYYVDIITGPSFSGPAVTAPITDRIKALKGKKIGITGPGSGTEALVDFLLAQVKLSPTSDVTLVSLGSDSSAAIGALKTGQVDALSFAQPLAQQAEATNVGSVYISPARGDIPSLKGVVHGVVFTTQTVMDKKGPAVRAFVRAIKKAEAVIHGDPAEVTKLFGQYLSNMNPDTVKKIIPILQAEIPASPEITEDAYGKSAAFHLKSGLIDIAPKYSDLVPSKWIDSALKG